MPVVGVPHIAERRAPRLIKGIGEDRLKLSSRKRIAEEFQLRTVAVYADSFGGCLRTHRNPKWQVDVSIGWPIRADGR
jgi:hypothetical protein